MKHTFNLVEEVTESADSCHFKNCHVKNHLFLYIGPSLKSSFCVSGERRSNRILKNIHILEIVLDKNHFKIPPLSSSLLCIVVCIEVRLGGQTDEYCHGGDPLLHSGKHCESKKYSRISPGIFLRILPHSMISFKSVFSIWFWRCCL